MLTNPSSRKTGILYIDDEEKALKYFRLAFAQKFEIFTAMSGQEGLRLLRSESDRIAIVISDQRMPEMLGAELLEMVRNEYPDMVRILTTAYSDLDSAIQAVNRGHIYQYVVKPWEVPEFGMVLQRAADYHHVLTERNELLAVKMITLQRVLCSDRVKWLLLATRAWPEAEQGGLRRALVELIKALPSQLNPVRSKAVAGVSAADFDINRLVAGEYANATTCLDALESVRGGEGSWEVRAEAALEDLAAALADDLKVPTESIQRKKSGTGFEISLRDVRIGRSALAGSLGGVLAEKESSAMAIHLLRSLVAVAMAGSTLVIASEAGDFRFEVGGGGATATDVIDALQEEFARADIAGLAPRSEA